MKTKHDQFEGVSVQVKCGDHNHENLSLSSNIP